MLNHTVASRMSMLVVNLFEVIYVNQHERARNIVASPSFKLLSECAAKATTIRQSRQIISIRFSAQAIHLLLERDELCCARDEQSAFDWHLKIVKRTERNRLAAPRRGRRRTSNQKHCHAIFDTRQRVDQIICANASQIDVNDDEVRARASQRNERRSAARHADDREARTLKC